MGLDAASYVSGARDQGVLPSETRELAHLARGRHLVVEGAGHLGVIQGAADQVAALALDTFLRAEGRARCWPPKPAAPMRARTAPAVSRRGRAALARGRPRS